jgi:hypothetical protein
MNRLRPIAMLIAALFALALLSAPPSPAQSDDAAALSKQIETLMQAKKFAEATPMAERLVSIQQTKYGPDNPETLKALETLAKLYRAQNRMAEANAIDERIRKSRLAQAAPGSPNGAPRSGPAFTTRGMRPPAVGAPPPAAAAPPGAAPRGMGEIASSAPRADLPDFPWPPPQVSASYNLPRNLFQARSTVGQAVEKIVAALEQTGYVQRSYFRTQADGVALVTQLESINDDGTAQGDGKRWPVLKDSKDLVSMVRGLFYVDPGHYRVIVFILQDKPFVQSPGAVTGDQAREWLRSGANMLPHDVAARPFGQGEVSVLVYEFASDGTAVRRVDSKLTGKQHLEKAGVLSFLEKTN